MRRVAFVARPGRGGVAVGPARVERELEDGVGGARVEIAGQDLRKLRRVEGGLGQDQLDLLLAGALAYMIEVRAEDAELPARGAIAQPHPVDVPGARRLPRKRARQVRRLREPEAARGDEIVALARIQDRVLGDALVTDLSGHPFPGPRSRNSPNAGNAALQILHLLAQDFLQANEVGLLRANDLHAQLASRVPAVAGGFILGQRHADVAGKNGVGGGGGIRGRIRRGECGAPEPGERGRRGQGS